MGWLRSLFGISSQATRHEPSQSYTVGIVGESHRNADGSSRQAEIKRCCEGERVSLLPEPENPHDPRAIAVLSIRGTCLGYISREHNEWIGQKLVNDELVSTTIHAIIGGEKGKPSRGVLLEVRTAIAR